jgi:hypothetical protein
MNLVREKRKNNIFSANKQKKSEFTKEKKKLLKKHLIDKIHKLIVKELKFNINHHIQTRKNHNLIQI